MGEELMHTKQLAEQLGTSERFVAHQVRRAAKAKRLEIQHVPGEGRRVYVDPQQFKAWLEERGYRDTARKLTI